MFYHDLPFTDGDFMRFSNRKKIYLLKMMIYLLKMVILCDFPIFSSSPSSK